METIHIFDEFQENNANLTKEQLHQKRTRLEPLVFDILKAKYGIILENHWKTHIVPTESDKSIIIVERRLHENLHFLIRNVAYFARDWCITIICSDVNLAYCKTILGHNSDNVRCIPLFKGVGTRDEGRNQYNELLKSPDFYERMACEHLFIVQTDSYLRKPIPDSIFQYDYVSAPFNWDRKHQGGGMSYRRRSAMIDICSRYNDATMIGEDYYISNGVDIMGYKKPNFKDALEYISESCFFEDAIGVHQWWTYFYPHDEKTNDDVYMNEIFDNYMRFEIIREMDHVPIESMLDVVSGGTKHLPKDNFSESLQHGV